MVRKGIMVIKLIHKRYTTIKEKLAIKINLYNGINSDILKNNLYDNYANGGMNSELYRL